MPKPLKRLLALVAATLLLAVNLPAVMAYHENDGEQHAFAHDDFWETWARTDAPVSSGQVERTWMWGPGPFTPGMPEEYADSPGGERLVQYFDKSRMELNNPAALDDDLWYVTNGLLVVEMVEGWWQVGDGAFDERPAPADQNIAGDPGEHPTYADISALNLQDAPATEVGTTITSTFEDDLTIGDDPTYANAGVTAAQYVPDTDHTVASPFWTFMNAQGLVFIEDADAEDELMGDGQFVTDELFENPYYATGLPITEAYWSTVAVDGTEHDVLWQCFERRCLTYTPANEPTWQVEAGNVGQHYYRWRYTQPLPADFDVVASGLLSPRGIEFGTDGTIYVAEAGLAGDECAMFGEGEEAFERCFGLTGAVAQITDDGDDNPSDEHTDVLSGLPSITFTPEEIVGPQDVIVDGDTIYALVGIGGPPEVRDVFGDEAAALGTIVRSTGDGNWEIVADLAAYEAEANPDGGLIDSNPFQFVMVDDGFVVTDAGANALVHVHADGTITTIAVFPDTMVDAPEFLGQPPGTQIPMQTVPTGLAIGPDGAYYMGQLTGFPFVPGAANVYRIIDENGDGDALDEGEVEVFESGFTTIVAVSFDGAGNLFVLEMVAGGLLNANPEDPSTFASRLWRIAPDGTRSEVPDEGLIIATGMGITADGTIYISNMGVPGDHGQLVRLHFQAEPVPTPPDFNVVVSGLDNPFDLDVDADGTVYVAEAGTAGDECVTVGEGEDAMERCFGLTGAVAQIIDDGDDNPSDEHTDVLSGLPSITFDVDIIGAHEVIVAGDTIYALIGLGGPPELRDEFGAGAEALGTIVASTGDGNWEIVADVSAYEGTANPDGGLIDSNPFSFVMVDDGFVVSDAGANALLHVAMGGTVSTIAVFPDTMTEAPPFLGLPPGTEIPMQAVPTGVAIGPDGAYYVGQLTGFPFTPSEANVYRVMDENADGDALDDGEVEVFAAGFSSIIDIEFDGAGNLYVLELIAAGLLSGDPADPSTLASGLHMVTPDGAQTEITVVGLLAGKGIEIAADGTIYVSTFMGDLVDLHHTAAPQP